MKKIITFCLIAIMSCSQASAFDLSSLLQGLEKASKSSGDSTATQSTGSKDKTSDALGGLGTLLGGVVESLTATSRLTPADLVGTWTYSAPAVTLDSDNAVKKSAEQPQQPPSSKK